jgi:hypothetical protein
MKQEKTRENRMHSSFSRERGLVWTVRAGLLAWRVRILRGGFALESQYPAIATGLPGISPGDRQQISSLTVARQRGIFTRFPVLITVMRTREPKGVLKELELRWKI